jgi:hypothetical protein
LEFKLGLSFGDDRRQVWFALGGLLAPLLFDNCIGRKRDVGGGVLAGLWSLVAFPAQAWEFDLAGKVRKRQLTVTFQKFIAFRRSACQTVVRRAGREFF